MVELCVGTSSIESASAARPSNYREARRLSYRAAHVLTIVIAHISTWSRERGVQPLGLCTRTRPSPLNQRLVAYRYVQVNELRHRCSCLSGGLELVS